MMVDERFFTTIVSTKCLLIKNKSSTKEFFLNFMPSNNLGGLWYSFKRYRTRSVIYIVQKVLQRFTRSNIYKM